MINNEFGSYLKKLRQRNDLTIMEVEIKSGVSSGSISRMESGKQDPSPDLLRKLAPALGVIYEEMMVEAGFLDEIPNYSDVPDDIRNIIGICEKLTPEQRQKLTDMIKVMFPEAF
jgi:transcriptional regulator with XRE-family HTH domain